MRARARARSSAWARRADRPPAYRRGANYRTYISRAPYRGARKRRAGPQSDAYSTDPPGPGARGPSDATTISETNPLMINKGVRQPQDPASVSRTTCPLNIHELPPRHAPRWRRRKRRRMAEGLIAIALICLTRAAYRSHNIATTLRQPGSASLSRSTVADDNTLFRFSPLRKMFTANDCNNTRYSEETRWKKSGAAIAP